MGSWFLGLYKETLLPDIHIIVSLIMLLAKGMTSWQEHKIQVTGEWFLRGGNAWVVWVRGFGQGISSWNLDLLVYKNGNDGVHISKYLTDVVLSPFMWPTYWLESAPVCSQHPFPGPAWLVFHHLLLKVLNNASSVSVVLFCTEPYKLCSQIWVRQMWADVIHHPIDFSLFQSSIRSQTH